jgi:hypothetical protein
MNCYRVDLPTTNGLRNTANIGGHEIGEAKYVELEDGSLYVIAEDACDVASVFPMAISIVRVGIGFDLPDQFETRRLARLRAGSDVSNRAEPEEPR